MSSSLMESKDKRNSSNIGSVSFKQAFKVWIRVALLSFGGPAGQIAVMHRILVQEKRWISENRFLHALNYTMLLPGPEAQQLAIYCGWLLNRAIGGLAAGILFVIPGFVSILILSLLYVGFYELSIVQGLFYGLKPAVMAVVLQALFKIGERVLKNQIMLLIACLAFIAIFFFNVPFPLIVISAGIVGLIGRRILEDEFVAINPRNAGLDSGEKKPSLVIDDDEAINKRPSMTNSLRVAITWLFIWFIPLFAIGVIFGKESVLFQEGIFFSKAAVVTFGGAYAVLAYIAQEAVNTFGWLNPGEMLDGLGMAETTPGPLIQVVQFVGFMGAYRQPMNFNPITAGILGSLVVTWVTFIPSFLWIFLGAPYIEYLRGNKSLSSALSAITAAVVGVILNLAIWFSLHTVFAELTEVSFLGMRFLFPVLETIDYIPVFIAGAALVALFKFKINIIITLISSAIIGVILYMV
jgi:chromate transporter